jgi:hypothetical protein
MKGTLVNPEENCLCKIDHPWSKLIIRAGTRLDALNKRGSRPRIPQEQERQHDLATALGIDDPGVLGGSAWLKIVL